MGGRRFLTKPSFLHNVTDPLVRKSQNRTQDVGASASFRHEGLASQLPSIWESRFCFSERAPRDFCRWVFLARMHPLQKNSENKLHVLECQNPSKPKPRPPKHRNLACFWMDCAPNLATQPFATAALFVEIAKTSRALAAPALVQTLIGHRFVIRMRRFAGVLERGFPRMSASLNSLTQRSSGNRSTRRSSHSTCSNRVRAFNHFDNVAGLTRR